MLYSVWKNLLKNYEKWRRVKELHYDEWKRKITFFKRKFRNSKKYDNNREFNYIDYLLNNENDDLNKPVSSELFTKMVHGTITSYTDTEKSLKK